jgi:hypothetical protein
MPITMDDLTISPQGVDCDNLLSDWTWAAPEPLRAVLITALGDVFAQGPSKAVYFVDVVGGSISRVAEDGATFQSHLRDQQFVTDHLFPGRIVELRQAGCALAAAEVYSHKRPLVLGGADELDNIEPADVSVHVSLHGQIHNQVRHLPAGTKLSEIDISF